MSRLFGFFLSAAIIILCLWLNVNSYPNVLRYEDVKAADETSAVSTDSSEQTQAIDGQDANKTQTESPKTEENSESGSSSGVESESLKDSSSKDSKESISASVEENLLNVSVASNQKFSSSERASGYGLPEASTNARSNAEKPQGGKYVSIPSVEVDAFRSRFGSDSGRVIGVSRASVVAE